MNKFKPYFHQVGIDSKYFTEDEFINSHVKNSKMQLSIFHVNIRSLNKHHNDLTTYLSMLDTKFDVICLSEIWSYNLEFYKAILLTFNHQQTHMLEGLPSLSKMRIKLLKEKT